MERSMILLFWFVAWMSSSDLGILFIQGQDYKRPDFISIDCGSSTAHSDSKFEIYYEADKGYADSGHSAQVSILYISQNLPSSSVTLRAFPDGTRNCYTLRPPSGGKYLIRASFLYGNYDGLGQAPTFDLHFGVNFWQTVSFESLGIFFHAEMIHVVPSTDDAVIQVCLVNTSTGIPFISSLELRRIDDSLYQTDNTTLCLFNRLNVGSNTSIRHPQDVYDRLWFPDKTNYDTSVKIGRWNLTTDPVLNPRNDSYDVPVEVLETYAYLKWYNSRTSIPAGKWFLYFHFAEMENLSSERYFTVSVNGKYVDSVSLNYLTSVTISSDFITSGTGFTIQLVPANGNQNPILNALEQYYTLDLLTLPTAIADVNAMNEIKTTYGVTRESWQGDPCLPTNFTWEGVSCTTEDPRRITSLNLSSSGLKGNIADSFASLANLQYLNLSHNKLSGSIPESLGNLENLKTLDLTGNDLSSSIPESLRKRVNAKTLQLSLDGSSSVCQSGSCGSSSSGQTKKIIVIALVIGLTVIVIGFIWMFLKKKQSARRKKGAGKIEMSRLQSDGISGKLRRRFTLAEITKITDNFDNRRVIGQGAFGKVFRGKLDDGTEVAVKKLSRSAREGPRQFQTEAKLLLKIHHRNLVLLLGYCDEPDNMALIYEYLAKGNLNENLSGKNGNLLTWDQRLCIAVDIVKGLEYLHNDCSPPIIHRDIKTANILLDKDEQAKISDFGLSRIFPSANTIPIATDPVGTYGYLDPEYRMSRNLTKKSDIYSFGVVLLELVTARAVQAGEHIVDWVAREVQREGYLQRIIDPRLDGQYDPNSAEKLVRIAMSCVEKTTARRPDIRKVHADLAACNYLTFERSEGTESVGRTSSVASRGRSASGIGSHRNAQASNNDSTASSSSYWSNFRDFSEYFRSL